MTIKSKIKDDLPRNYPGAKLARKAAQGVLTIRNGKFVLDPKARKK